MNVDTVGLNEFRKGFDERRFETFEAELIEETLVGVLDPLDQQQRVFGSEVLAFVSETRDDPIKVLVVLTYKELKDVVTMRFVFHLKVRGKKKKKKKEEDRL